MAFSSRNFSFATCYTEEVKHGKFGIARERQRGKNGFPQRVKTLKRERKVLKCNSASKTLHDGFSFIAGKSITSTGRDAYVAPSTWVS